ncbi:MAG TPA: hypothetical protein VL401_04000 [Alphaproteobacteria bacterium]|jgi:hypothetical protein|nr:hypothetical protein [Alphaproteobacteria bacterium]
MIKKFLIFIFLVFSIVFSVYLSWPAPKFPNTLWDFESSTEPADKETPLRRGYYTNLTRGQLMNHYSQQFDWGLRLNYPPEEAKTIIRDQTQATFLEEIVHPMRESLFIAGNEVKPEKGLFEINGKKFNQKVIVKYVESNIFVRLAIGILTLGLIWLLAKEYGSLNRNR